MRAWVHGPAQALLGKNQPTCSDNVGRAGRSVLASLLPLEKCRRPGSERPMALPYLLLVSGECRCTHRVVRSRCQHTERSKETPRLKTTAEILAPTDPPAKSVLPASSAQVAETPDKGASDVVEVAGQDESLCSIDMRGERGTGSIAQDRANRCPLPCHVTSGRSHPQMEVNPGSVPGYPGPLP
jgi:hypothetical protein